MLTWGGKATKGPDGVIEHAMVVTKPYSRKQAAKYVGRAVEWVRAVTVLMDGREAIAERRPEYPMEEFRSEFQALEALSLYSVHHNWHALWLTSPAGSRIAVQKTYSNRISIPQRFSGRQKGRI